MPVKKNKTPSEHAPRTPEEKQLLQRRIIGIVSVIVMIGLFVLIMLTVGRRLVETFSKKDEFRAWVNGSGILGPLAMIGVSCLQVVVAIIPGEPFELAAGYAFGWVWGSVWCMIGFAVASSIIFLLVKRFGMKFILLFFSQEKIDSISFLKDSKRLNLLTFVLFLIPGSPKDVLTYFIGVTPMKLRTFLLITLVARIPSIISSTITGHLTASENYTAAIITYAITGVITVLCILWYRQISKKQKAEALAAKADGSPEA